VSRPSGVRVGLLLAGLGALLGLAGPAAAVQTNLQETTPLVWVILAISIGGALITFAILAYTIWKFRDPTTRGRRYG
jgi:uncharacterized integral membrane protein